MKRFKMSIIFCVAFVMLLVIPLGSDAQAKDIELKFADFLPPPHKIAIECDMLAKMITEFTDGKVKIIVGKGNVSLCELLCNGCH